MHLGMHTDIRANVHAHACACLRACTCACTHTCTARTRTHMHMHAHLHAHTHARMCARTHPRARTHAQEARSGGEHQHHRNRFSVLDPCLHALFGSIRTLRVVDRPDMRMMYMSPQIPSGRSSRKPINTFEHVSVTSFLASSYSFVCFSVYLADQCS